jgi:cytochrome c peroxidase
LWLVGLAVGLVSCFGDEVTSNSTYQFKQPDNFPRAVYTFNNNPITEDRFELGRALFYDPVLSIDSSVSCANCHQQARAFIDPVHRLSRGVNDAEGFRNAPAIQNMAFQESFFWDGGVKHLDFVPINAITNPAEMHESLAHVVEKLKRSKSYSNRFKKAFTENEITSQQMLYALSQFMNLMVSANSRYDKWVRNEGELLTAEELEGLSLFQSKCSSCHATDLFTDDSFRNNGLDTDFSADTGRQRITEAGTDAGKFKVPSLRNAELTYPYMHDGRFRTLNDVLNHYTSGVKSSATLDPALNQNGQLGIVLTEEEKTKVIKFLKTLTDESFIKNKLFTNPFRN